VSRAAGENNGVRVAPAHVVRGERPVAEVAEVLRLLAARTKTVVLRQVGRDERYYLFDTKMLLRGLSQSSTRSVIDAFDMDELPAVSSVDLSEVQPFTLPGTVVLLGRTVVGVVEQDGGTRSGGPSPTDRLAHGAADEVPESATSAATEAPVIGRPAAGRFRAFPALAAPNAVRAGVPFTIRVGFRSTPRDDFDVPLIIPGADPFLRFTVQVVGFGFTFPGGIRRQLLVDRDDPETGSVELTVEAKPVDGEALRSLEVSYEYRGNVCGLAWHDVLVTESSGTAAPEGLGRTGGSGLTVVDHSDAPHLTVEIHGRDGLPELQFLFSSRYDDLPRPGRSVTSELDHGSSQAFAIQLMAQIPTTPSISMWQTLRGAGRTVADVLPPEFWTLLEFVWRRARDAAEVPTLLLITSDPWIPWELAWVDDRRVAADLLPDPTSTLGALVQVGRWIPPVTRDRTGADMPPTPPEDLVDVGGMAIVVGDYAGDTAGELPGAVQEGRDLAVAYRARRLAAKDSDVLLLMAGRLEQDGSPFHPALVHFAAHGESSPQAQQYTGIVLVGERRLDPLVVRGSDLPRLSRPFVFLNACEVGTAGRLLSTYAGLAGALLVEGCRGFLAPLWKVGDEEARRVALAFYEAALDQGIPVGEVVRRIRAQFGPDSTSLVPMAYVYYGHPQLKLRTSDEGVAP